MAAAFPLDTQEVGTLTDTKQIERMLYEIARQLERINRNLDRIAKGR